ncbi:MAG: hypothetical protein J5982_06350 [Bacilli bacterium]|nr:hypothetical protein [Bacilli bacterium]
MYAYYEPQLYDVTFSGSHVSFSTNPLKVPYTKSSQITLTPASGYYFESISCSTGYTVSGFASGTAHYSTQTITITNNTHVGGGTCTITMHARSYPATYTIVGKNPYQCCTTTNNCHEECSCTNGWACDMSAGYCQGYCIGGAQTCNTVCDQSCSTCYNDVWGYTCPNGGTLSGTTCVF